MVYQILSYLSVEGNEPPSEVVPHPDTTKEAPSGMDIADDGKVTGAALKKGKTSILGICKKAKKKELGQNNPFIFNLHAIGGLRFKDKDTSVIADIKIIIAGVGDNLGNINDFSTGSVSA